MKRKNRIIKLAKYEPLDLTNYQIRLELNEAKWIAEQKSISYHSLMRMWIVEGIERDINILSKRRTDTSQRANRRGKKGEKS